MRRGVETLEALQGTTASRRRAIGIAKRHFSETCALKESAASPVVLTRRRDARRSLKRHLARLVSGTGRRDIGQAGIDIQMVPELGGDDGGKAHFDREAGDA